MENTKYCFVIQPISKATYNKRFRDVFKPAIEKAGLIPYRVDLDPSVRNIIETIGNKIVGATLCLADISMDNPNVWYELGYAIALHKDVVIVCDENRESSYPFDISHMSVINYVSDSTSDFRKLEEEIIKKIQTYLSTPAVQSQYSNREIFRAREVMSMCEKHILSYLISEQTTDDEDVPVYSLKEEMQKRGLSNVETGIGLRLLVKKGMVKTYMAQDYQGYEFSACGMTSVAEEYILNHSEDIISLDEIFSPHSYT